MDTLNPLEKLVAFPTVCRNPNIDLISFVEGFLGWHGIDCTLVHDDSGRTAKLYATIGPQDRPGVMLSGHRDVVPVVGQEWSSDPVRLRRADGFFYGRGTAYMRVRMRTSAEVQMGSRLLRPVSDNLTEVTGLIGHQQFFERGRIPLLLSEKLELALAYSYPLTVWLLCAEECSCKQGLRLPLI